MFYSLFYNQGNLRCQKCEICGASRGSVRFFTCHVLESIVICVCDLRSIQGVAFDRRFLKMFTPVRNFVVWTNTQRSKSLISLNMGTPTESFNCMTACVIIVGRDSLPYLTTFLLRHRDGLEDTHVTRLLRMIRLWDRSTVGPLRRRFPETSNEHLSQDLQVCQNFRSHALEKANSHLPSPRKYNCSRKWNQNLTATTQNERLNHQMGVHRLASSDQKSSTDQESDASLVLQFQIYLLNTELLSTLKFHCRERPHAPNFVGNFFDLRVVFLRDLKGAHFDWCYGEPLISISRAISAQLQSTVSVSNIESSQL